MKKERTLLQKLTPYFFLATGIPIALFAMVSQYRLHMSLSQNLDSQIMANLNHADKHLDMVLDKYNTLLYDFSTDDGVIALVDSINQNQDDLEINSSKIRRELSHICNRNSDIAGITIFAENGTVIYFDRMSASSVNSSWAAEVENLDVERGTVYRRETKPIVIGDETIYPFRIARKLVDYTDIRRPIGKVVMTINEKVLRDAMHSGEERNYLFQEGYVISAFDNRDIGKTMEQINQGNNRIHEVRNKTCSLMIYNRQSLDEYYETLLEQGMLWVLIAVATMGMTLGLSYVLTRPYLKEIDAMAGAISEVEKGNFQVRLPITENMSKETRRISSGFNQMVKQIEALIEQVKSAILEQRNAELSALEAQIDPHFLYNTLDAINWKAIEKGEFEISEMVGALADILRYTVKNAGDETSIDQELYWLHQYVLIQSIKAGKALKVKMDVPEDIKGCRIHKLLLQPFVENAIKHGMRSKEGECKIELSMRHSGKQIHILVKDNGCGITTEMLEQLNASEMEDEDYGKVHLGIMNVRKRLQLYYGEQADFYFESETGHYTKVHLFIPAITNEDGEIAK